MSKREGEKVTERKRAKGAMFTSGIHEVHFTRIKLDGAIPPTPVSYPPFLGIVPAQRRAYPPPYIPLGVHELYCACS